jgi:hypothetical protein
VDYGIVKEHLEVWTHGLGKGAGGPARVGMGGRQGGELQISREDGMKLKHLLASLLRDPSALSQSMPRSSHHFVGHFFESSRSFNPQGSLACGPVQVPVEDLHCSAPDERANAFAWIRSRIVDVQPLRVCRMQVVCRRDAHS